MQPVSPLVMIVDDNEDSREIYGTALRRLGFSVVAVGTAEQALLQAGAERPDVIVADVFLPGMSGLSLTRKLRNDARLAHIAVIVLTALTREPACRRAEDAGADRFLQKPCLPDELAAVIGGVLPAHFAAWSISADRGARRPFLTVHSAVTPVESCTRPGTPPLHQPLIVQAAMGPAR